MRCLALGAFSLRICRCGVRRNVESVGERHVHMSAEECGSGKHRICDDKDLAQ